MPAKNLKAMTMAYTEAGRPNDAMADSKIHSVATDMVSNKAYNAGYIWCI